jgi:hypothetical protein
MSGYHLFSDLMSRLLDTGTAWSCQLDARPTGDLRDSRRESGGSLYVKSANTTPLQETLRATWVERPWAVLDCLSQNAE